MKCILILAFTVAGLQSCKEGWTDEHKAAYRTQCLQEAAGMYATKAGVEAYCDCNLDAVMKHYAHPSDLIENKDSAAVRRALEDCSLSAQNR